MSSRLSFLSKLNLMGLIDLAMIAVTLKINQRVDEAIRACEEAVLSLKVQNKLEDQENPIGVASQNLVEELHENLLKVKENDLDLEEYT